MKKFGKDFWGAIVWIFLHCCAIIQHNPELFIEMLNLFVRLLPCDYCKQNLHEKLKKYNPSTYQDNLFFYTYILHDLVNIHKTKTEPDKPKISPPYNVAYEFYVKLSTTKDWWRYAWGTIHIFATTITQSNAAEYKRFLFLLSELLPNTSIYKTIIYKHDPTPYLRDNNDAFFYSYTIHSLVNKNVAVVNNTVYIPPKYEEVKHTFFLALGKDCSDCRI